jgi:hypothetical protein
MKYVQYHYCQEDFVIESHQNRRNEEEEKTRKKRICNVINKNQKINDRNVEFLVQWAREIL